MTDKVVDVSDELRDEILDEHVGAVRGSRWSKKAEAQLAEYYPNGVPIPILAERLDGGKHTRDAVEKKAQRLGLRRRNTEDEGSNE